MAKDDDDAIILPKKSKAKPVSASSKPVGAGGASAPMRRLMRITRVIGVTLGGFVSVVGLMSVVGLAVSNVWVRLGAAVVVLVVIPALLSDRLLKRTSANLATRGALGMVGDTFAIVLLGIALLFVAADSVTRTPLMHEGDLYARAGADRMARTVYFLAGVSPVFPSERAAQPASPASASAGSAAAPPSAAPPPSR